MELLKGRGKVYDGRLAPSSPWNDGDTSELTAEPFNGGKVVFMGGEFAGPY